jgi:hypothetical protein
VYGTFIIGCRGRKRLKQQWTIYLDKNLNPVLTFLHIKITNAINIHNSSQSHARIKAGIGFCSSVSFSFQS